MCRWAPALGTSAWKPVKGPWEWWYLFSSSSYFTFCPRVDRLVFSYSEESEGQSGYCVNIDQFSFGELMLGNCQWDQLPWDSCGTLTATWKERHLQLRRLLQNFCTPRELNLWGDTEEPFYLLLFSLRSFRYRWASQCSLEWPTTNNSLNV